MDRRLGCVVLAVAALAPGCGGQDAPSGPPTWQVVFEEQPAAILRAWGRSSRDVYVVGADVADAGPLALHFDGERWTRLSPPTRGDLWWVQGVGPDDVRMVGDGGVALKYTPSTGAFEVRPTAETQTLFGVWGSSPDDVWYVGGAPGRNEGVILRDDGATVTDSGFTATASATFFKAHGFAADDVWFVGQQGRTVRYDGQSATTPPTGTPLPIMGIHGQDRDHLYAVGGVADGVMLAWDGARWVDETPAGTPQMIAVWATGEDEAYAAGYNGHLYRREAGVWAPIAPAAPTYQDLHALWVDETGGVWVVGGRLAEDPPTGGVLLHYGAPVPTEVR